MNAPYLNEPQRVVLKFPAPRDRFINVTEGATVVLADHQEGVPTLWVEMDPDAPPVEWHVMSVATGEFDRIGPDDVHLGSFVVPCPPIVRSRRPSLREGRWLVWHMYRRPT